MGGKDNYLFAIVKVLFCVHIVRSESMTKRNVLLALGAPRHHYYRGVARYALEHEWLLVADMVHTGEIPRGWKGDGIVSYTGYRNDLVKYFARTNAPRVEASLLCPHIQVPRVAGDNLLIGRAAAMHFLERGFKHFAWAPCLEDPVNLERHRGYSQALAENKVACHVLPQAYRLNGRQLEMAWLVHRESLVAALLGLPRPLAVFCFNDWIAADLMGICEGEGLSIPEDVAVFGVDNDLSVCESIPVPLSSVWHDLERVAYEAAALLDRLMDGEALGNPVVRIPPKGVITRKSTDVFAVTDPNVSRALRYVRENYPRSLLSVSDLVSASDVSRRPLEKAFRQQLGRSLHDEIIRVRMAKVKELLQTTDLAVAAIAQATGFTRPQHLFRIFRNQTGMSPRRFRQLAEHPPRRNAVIPRGSKVGKPIEHSKTQSGATKKRKQPIR
jgi:LacI family transcriptional regulator